MKIYNLTNLLSNLYKLIFVLCFLITVLNLIPLHSETIGKIQIFKGNVQIKSTPNDFFNQVFRYQSINNGDVIKTDSRGYAEVLMPDGTLIRVSPNSEFSIKKEKKKRSIFLNGGRLWSSIKKLIAKEEMQFETPSLVASIRGTVIQMDKNYVGCEEGEVDVKNRNGESIRIKANEEVTLSRNGDFRKRDLRKKRSDTWKDELNETYANEFNAIKNQLITYKSEFTKIEDLFNRVKNEPISDELNEESLNLLLTKLELISDDARRIFAGLQLNIENTKLLFSSRKNILQEDQSQKLYTEIKQLVNNEIIDQINTLKSIISTVDKKEAEIRSILEHKGSAKSLSQPNKESKKPSKSINDIRDQSFMKSYKKASDIKKNLNNLNSKVEFYSGQSQSDTVYNQLNSILVQIDEISQELALSFSVMDNYLRDNKDRRSELLSKYNEVQNTQKELLTTKSRIDRMVNDIKREKQIEERQKRRQNNDDEEQSQIRILSDIVNIVNEMKQKINVAFTERGNIPQLKNIYNKLKSDQLLINSLSQKIDQSKLPTQDIQSLSKDIDKINLLIKEEQTEVKKSFNGNNSPNNNAQVKKIKETLTEIDSKIEQTFRKIESLKEEIDSIKSKILNSETEETQKIEKIKNKINTLKRNFKKTGEVKAQLPSLAKTAKKLNNREVNVLLSRVNRKISSFVDKSNEVDYARLIAELEQSDNEKVDKKAKGIIEEINRDFQSLNTFKNRSDRIVTEASSIIQSVKDEIGRKSAKISGIIRDFEDNKVAIESITVPVSVNLSINSATDQEQLARQLISLKTNKDVLERAVRNIEGFSSKQTQLKREVRSDTNNAFNDLNQRQVRLKSAYRQEEVDLDNLRKIINKYDNFMNRYKGAYKQLYTRIKNDIEVFRVRFQEIIRNINNDLLETTRGQRVLIATEIQEIQARTTELNEMIIVNRQINSAKNEAQDKLTNLDRLINEVKQALEDYVVR